MTKGRKTTYEERIEIVFFCIENHKDYQLAVDTYQVSYQQVYSWVRKYEAQGVESLRDKRGRTKPEGEMTELEKLRAENKQNTGTTCKPNPHKNISNRTTTAGDRKILFFHLST